MLLARSKNQKFSFNIPNNTEDKYFKIINEVNNSNFFIFLVEKELRLRGLIYSHNLERMEMVVLLLK